MQALCDFAKTYGPVAGRFLITLLFLRSAFGKIVGFTAVSGMMAKKGMPFAEVFLVGAIFLIPATLIFHNFWAVDPAQLRELINQTNHFYKNVTILGALVFIMGMGSGALSLKTE
jgi:putative oxidoreductase